MSLRTVPPATSAQRPAVPSAGQQDRHAWFPGVGLALAVGIGAFLLNTVWAPLSPLLLAIIVGVVLANVVTLPAVLAPGIAVAGRRLLRIGIVLLGLQLSLRDVAALGPGVVGIVVAVVLLGIGTTLLWGRLLGMPFLQTLLIACGFSICGAAAVAAVDGVVDAEEEDAATAIALVVLFGTVMIPVSPALGALLGFSEHARGIFAGASIHEVAQVVAAGGLIGSGALATAVLVKLARVLMLAPVMAGVSLWRRRAADGSSGHRPPLVPLFVGGFVVAVLLRTTGTVPAGVLQGAKMTQTVLLAAAMFALGLGVRVAALRAVGPRPLLLGILSTLSVVTIAGVGVWLVA